MTPDTDPILAALGGSIPAARAIITDARPDVPLDKESWPPRHRTEAAICDLALRALDAMGRPAGGDEKLRRLLDVLKRLWLESVESKKSFDVMTTQRSELQTQANAYQRACFEAEALLSEPDPASDGRTGSCAECERLNADVLAYRRKERKILGLPDEALAEDHIDAITSLKNDKDGWEAECEMQRVTKQRIIAERDEARAECERLARELEAAQATNKSLERYRTTVGNLRSVMQDDDHRAWVAMGRPENTRTTNAVLICEKFAELTEAIATLTRERDAARADQAAMARRELEAFGSDALNLRALPADAPVQVVRDIIAEKLRAHIADLPAENGEQDAVKPAEPANPPASPAAGDWPEDGCHENGAYHCACIACGATFIGHKRRVVCKVCSEKTANPPASPDGSTADAEARLATKVENQRMHIKSLDRVIADLKANGNLRAGKLGAHRREMRRMFADKEQQLRSQGEIIAKLKEQLHGVQVTAPPVPARPAEGEGVEVAPRGQGEPEEGRARIVWHVADRAAACRGESGGVDVTEGDRADGATGESAAAERDQPNAIGRADADDGEGDDRRGAHVTAPDAEARIAAWERHAMSGFDPHHDAVVVLAPSEVDTAAALMRSLAAVAAKAQAEVERLRADAEQLRADVARTDDKIGAMEIHGNSADYWYRKALARGKANEDFRAKLREELAMASQVEADLRTQLVVMERKLAEALRGGGK